VELANLDDVDGVLAAQGRVLGADLRALYLFGSVAAGLRERSRGAVVGDSPATRDETRRFEKDPASAFHLGDNFLERSASLAGANGGQRGIRTLDLTDVNRAL
jgi:hypothetical protein